MGHSTAINLRDVVRVMRVVRESCELGDDALAWRSHFSSEILKLIGNASTVFVGVLPLPIDPEQMAMPLALWVGAQPEQLAYWESYIRQGNVSKDPTTPHIMSLQYRDFTRRREQLLSDRDWYASKYFNEFRRPVNMDDLLYTQVTAPGGKYASGIGIMHELADRPFNARQTAIVHLAHMELAKIWRDGAQALAHLSPRLVAVLELICQGYAEREVAEKLFLSRNTVHNYVSMLHQKLEVRNRGELVRRGMALLRRQGPRLLPNQA